MSRLFQGTIGTLQLGVSTPNSGECRVRSCLCGVWGFGSCQMRQPIFRPILKHGGIPQIFGLRIFTSSPDMFDKGLYI